MESRETASRPNGNGGGGGDPDAPVTALVGIVGAILLFVLIVLLQAFFYRAEREENTRKVVAATSEELAGLRALQQETLSSYRILDEKQGIVTIPIERAMELVALEAASASVAPSGVTAPRAGAPATPAAPGAKPRGR